MANRDTWGSRSARRTLGIAVDPGATPAPQRVISLWVYATDCDAAVETLRRAGVEILEEPMTQPWGERIARVRDPDGNVVIIGARVADEAGSVTT